MLTIKNLNQLFAGLLISAAFLTAEGEEFTIPQKFVPGEPALAAEMNENFSAIADAMNSLNDKIADMESQISDLEEEVANLENNDSSLSTETLPGTYRLILSETLFTASGDTGIINHTVVEGTMTLSPDTSATISLNGTDAQLNWTPWTDYDEESGANLARLNVEESASGENFSGSGNWQLFAGGSLSVNISNGPTINFTVSQSGNTLIGSLASESQTFVGIRLPD